MQKRSEQFVPQVENDSTTDKTESTSYQGQEAPGSTRKSPTQESLHPSKNKTLSVRKKISKPPTSNHELISNIESGVNFKREGLRRLLESVCEGTVDQVVVAHRDCLASFAFDLIEFVCKKSGCNVVVHRSANTGKSERNRVNELSEELLAITSHFTAQHYGWPSVNNRRQQAHCTRNKQVGRVDDTDIRLPGEGHEEDQART